MLDLRLHGENSQPENVFTKASEELRKWPEATNKDKFKQKNKQD